MSALDFVDKNTKPKTPLLNNPISPQDDAVIIIVIDLYQEANISQLHLKN